MTNHESRENCAAGVPAVIRDSRFEIRALLAAALCAGLLLLRAPDEHFTSTFSIACMDPESKDFGVAVCTLPPRVGNIVPWAKAGVGAVATQAWTNGGFGPRGLDLLAAGKSAQETIDALLKDDANRESRQIGVIDTKGEVAAFSGKRCQAWAGSKQGKHFTIQGNILVSEETVNAMAKAFEETKGPLAERMMRALEAGHAAGGDKRGHSSAALLVVRADIGGMKGYDRRVDLRVDEHAHPIKELRRLLSGRGRLGDRVLERPHGRDVLELTRKLKEAGYLDAESDVFTDRVADAVRRARKDAGLKDGESVDDAVLAALAKPREPLKVGAAKVEITPVVEPFEDKDGDKRRDKDEPFEDKNGNEKYDPVWMAGFGQGRAAFEVHDPLWARAVVFEKGAERALVVSLDLVGMLHMRVKALKARIEKETGIAADRTIVSCTHTHAGPDTIGMWGALLLSGLDPAYLKSLEERIVECVKKALEARVPATIACGKAEAPAGVLKDTRAPDVRNPVLGALVAWNERNQPVAVLANFAMHPEAMMGRNVAVSSDYPHYLREALEKEFAGAVAVYLQADCGGMQTPDVKERTWEETRRVGEALAATTKAALSGAAPFAVGSIKAARAPLSFPLENKRFQTAMKAGIFGDPGDAITTDAEGRTRVASEIVAIRVGDAVFLSCPGEALPEVGRELFAAIDAKHRFLLGLGNDEVGYILPKEDFDPKKYEESMSLGPETAPVLLEAVRKLLKGF